MQLLPGLPQRLLAAGLLSALIALGPGLPGVANADSSNQQIVSQEEIEVPGETTEGDGSVAIAGPATAYSNAVVHQLNVQVANGDETALANSSQTAGNTADVNQTSVAVAGDATATGGGVATTGHAVAGTHAVLIQLNIQVMALLSPDCAVDQVASNDAQVDQTAAALSGDATAEGAGSDASSGDARAFARYRSVQRNVQVYVCTGRNSDGSPAGAQDAANALAASQEALAISGDAFAVADSDAATGDARALTSGVQHQSSRQIAVE